MSSFSSLKNHFLIAMPNLKDPYFSKTVTYIWQHDKEGAMGIVVNQLSTVFFAEVLQQVGVKPPLLASAYQAVYLGGPVQPERGFILHSTETSWAGTIACSSEIALTVSPDILQAIAEQQGPKQFLMALGYAGWEPGQLELELVENSWLAAPANTEILFKTPVHERWHKAAALMGVDLQRMTSLVGHA